MLCILFLCSEDWFRCVLYTYMCYVVFFFFACQPSLIAAATAPTGISPFTIQTSFHSHTTKTAIWLIASLMCFPKIWHNCGPNRASYWPISDLTECTVHSVQLKARTPSIPNWLRTVTDCYSGASLKSTQSLVLHSARQKEKLWFSATSFDEEVKKILRDKDLKKIMPACTYASAKHCAFLLFFVCFLQKGVNMCESH